MKTELEELEVEFDIVTWDNPEEREEEIGNNQGDPNEEEEPPGGN